MYFSRCSQTDVRTTVLSPVSLLPAIFIARVVGTADKLIAGVMESMKIREQYEIAGVNDTNDI
jgi:hypothetical protein